MAIYPTRGVHWASHTLTCNSMCFIPNLCLSLMYLTVRLYCQPAALWSYGWGRSAAYQNSSKLGRYLLVCSNFRLKYHSGVRGGGGGKVLIQFFTVHINGMATSQLGLARLRCPLTEHFSSLLHRIWLLSTSFITLKALSILIVRPAISRG